MSIKAGRLHHKAELQGKTITADDIGGDAVTWVKERDLWCHIAEPSGRMMQVAMMRNEQIAISITARYNSDITTSKRVSYDGKVYMIEAVTREGTRKEMMTLTALEGVPT